MQSNLSAISQGRYGREALAKKPETIKLAVKMVSKHVTCYHILSVTGIFDKDFI